MSGIKLVLPELQVDFAYALREIRGLCLQDALSETVSALNVAVIDAELHEFADKTAISKLASHGMRGELLFAVPSILMHNPRLLSYYRLLLGYSQKEFYEKNSGLGIFRMMEVKGRTTARQLSRLNDLCAALNDGANYLLTALSEEMVNTPFFDQLTILTLGPQFRGGANVKRGTASINDVFNIIHQIVQKYVHTSTSRRIELTNTSGRRIIIQFAADPDIVIREELAPNHFKNLTAIEVKGGQDYSNIHNRVGEAEKRHQKAKKAGYIECWTVVNVDRINTEMAKRESPTSSRFYRISELQNPDSSEYKDFVMQIISTIGIN